jgi:hypothetical protein
MPNGFLAINACCATLLALLPMRCPVVPSIHIRALHQPHSSKVPAATVQ